MVQESNLVDEIQNLDEYTVFVPVGNVTLPTPAVCTIVILWHIR